MSRHSVKTVLRFVCSTAFQSELGNSWEGWRDWIPAQLRRMWIPLFGSEVDVRLGMREETESWEERSQGVMLQLRERDVMVSLVVVLVVFRWGS